MKAKKFALAFRHLQSTHHAKVDVIQVKGHHRFPLYRVAVDREKGKADIYIFYKIPEEKEPFFWYPQRNDDMVKAIATALAKQPSSSL